MSESDSPDYRAPSSVEELLQRYARGERSFRRLEIAEAQLRRAELSDVDLHASDLALADLCEANLGRAHLRRARLVGADLGGAILEGAHLSLADLSRARLVEARLQGADLVGADLRGARFARADLSGADLTGADLAGADLSGADLGEACLRRAHLRATRLEATRFAGALFGETALVDVDLGVVEGLTDVRHCYPSGLATSTLQRSGGRIPAAFLRGCGLSEWEIEGVKLYAPDLHDEDVARLTSAIAERRRRLPSRPGLLFIICSQDDEAFVAALEDGLATRGLRSWRNSHPQAAEDRPVPRRHRPQERLASDNPTLLLVLSRHSVASDWIAGELQQALRLGEELERRVLHPVALDETWKTCAWPKAVWAELTSERVLDFSDWQAGAAFEQRLGRLLQVLPGA